MFRGCAQGSGTEAQSDPPAGSGVSGGAREGKAGLDPARFSLVEAAQYGNLERSAHAVGDVMMVMS